MCSSCVVVCSLQLAGRGANKLGGVGHCVPERASLGPPRVQLHANRARGQQDAGQVGAVGCGGPDFDFFKSEHWQRTNRATRTAYYAYSIEGKINCGNRVYLYKGISRCRRISCLCLCCLLRHTKHASPLGHRSLCDPKAATSNEFPAKGHHETCGGGGTLLSRVSPPF